MLKNLITNYITANKAMNENKFLQQRLVEWFGTQRIEATQLPLIITKNLNPKFKIRPYQELAFKYFLNY